MKKIIALLAFALVTALVGCGGGGGREFVLNRGDNGAWLEEHGFKDVKIAYETINSELSEYNNSNDSNGNKRAAAIMKYVSEKYTGKDIKHEDGSVTKMSTAEDLSKRLKDLINSKKFEGMEIIPFKTNKGAETDKEVNEQTKLYVAKFVHNGGNYSNKEYIFDSVKWKNEGTAETPDWKIVSGFDDLGKSASELTK